MKRVFSVVVAGCLLSVLLLGSAGAQEPGTKIRASIPFDFTEKRFRLVNTRSRV